MSFFGPDGWGPVSHLRPVIDFTVGFQDIIATLLFSVVFTIWAAGQLATKRRRDPIIHRYDDPSPEAHKFRLLVWSKWILNAALIALVAVAIGFSTSQPTSTKVALAFLIVATAVFQLHHVHFTRFTWKSQTSTMSFYLFVVLSTAMRIRTEFTRLSNAEPIADKVDKPAFAIILCIILAVSTLAFVLENIPRISKERIKELGISPFDTTNLISFLTFQWVQPQMTKGYEMWRHKVVMEEDSVMRVSDSFESCVVYGRFEREWEKELKKAKPSLFMAMLRTYGWEFIFPLFLGLTSQTLQFAQPQLLNALIKLIQSYADPTIPNENLSSGYELALGFFAAAVLQSIFFASFLWSTQAVGVKVRTTFMHAVFRKALRLSPGGKAGRTIGQMGNLISVDSERFFLGLGFQWFLFFAPYEIALGLYFLYQQLSYAIFAGVGLILIAMPLQAYCGGMWAKVQKDKMAAMDTRNKLINELLAGIKTVKLYNWEKPFLNRIFTARALELKAMRKGGIILTFLMTIFLSIPNLITLVCFAVYAAIAPEDKPLDANRVFVSISLFGVIQGAVSFISQILAMTMEMRVAYGRIAAFMQAEELDPEAVETLSRVSTNATLSSHDLMTTKDEKSVVQEVAAAPDAVIAVENASFEWEKGKSTIKDVNIHIAKGQLVAIVGRVGTGKTSLLSGMIGDMYKTAGKVSISGSVAYCPQSAWIMNGTVKHNILFGKEYDEKRMQDVIHACNLEPDLEALPNGINAEIGEKGVNVSGGQQARIALARAAYADTDIVLLDDPLSAVDAYVDKFLFDNLVGSDGMLKGKTRVLVTHGIHHLNHVDKIILLDDGCIAEQGTFDELMAKEHGIFRTLVDDYSRTRMDKSEETEKGKDQGKTDDTIKKALVGNDQQEKEFVALGKVASGVYVQYFKATSLAVAVIVVGSFALGQAAQTGAISWMSHYTNELAAGNNPRIAVYLAFYGALTLAMVAFISIGTYSLLAIGALRASKRLFEEMAHTVVRLPMGWFDTTPLGRVVNRFSKDVYSLDEPLPRDLVNLFPIALQVLATIVVIAVSTPFFLVTLIPVGIIFYFIQMYYMATSRATKRLDSGRTRSPIYAHFLETLSGVSSVRAYGHTTRFIREFDNRVDVNMHPMMAWVSGNRWLSVRVESIGALVTFLAAIFVIVARHSISASIAGLSVSYSLQVTGFLTAFVRFYINVENEIVSVERIDEYTRLTTEPPAEIPDKDPPKSWPSEGSIEFKNFSARYRPGLPIVVKDLNFTVGAGQHVGVIGRTGSGKSTITMALFRIIEGTSDTEKELADGQILIDGVDISTIGLSALRSKISIIPQQPVLFAGTFRDNIDPWVEYTDAELWNALDAAHLKSFVSDLDGKLEAKIEQGGSNLSSGQRQMVSLCRALLRKSKILVLDEATSSVDLETDALIQQTIREHFKDSTVLAIAHRIKTIIDYDQILTLDAGRVVELAPPEQLLSDKASLFYKLSKEAGEVS